MSRSNNRSSAPAALLVAALAGALLGALAPAARAQEAPAGDADAPSLVAIRAGKVVTVDAADRILHDAVILIEGDRIRAVGPAREVEVPAGARVIDARDRWVVPGLVDCHNHTAGSLSDLNDGVWLTNPGLRTLDTLNPESEDMVSALSGGVTTVLLIPGSGNNMSGFGTVAHTAGETAEAMALRSPGSLKIAQAGNPERYWFGVGRSYMNWNLRQTLEKAQAYHRAWTAYEGGLARGEGADEDAGGTAAAATEPPERDLVWDGLRGLFERRFPVSVHTQMYQVVLKTITMLHDRFKLRVVLDHSTFDGFKTAPLVLDRGIYTIVGPRQYFFDRTERRIVGCAVKYYEAGVRKLGINTDAPVVPQEELTLQAALGVRLGLEPYVALKALTRVPAEALGLGELVGTIEPGKLADLGIWTGDPIDPRSRCLKTFVAGEQVYDVREEGRF